MVTPHPAASLLLHLISNNYDFVVTDSMNFDHDTEIILKSPYEFDKPCMHNGRKFSF
jgi:hypothetical protein